MDHMFCNGDLDSALRARLELVVPKIDQIPKDQFLTSSDNSVIEHVYDELQGEAIVLHETHMTTTESETQVDVSAEQSRLIRDRGRPTFVPGHTITIDIPFEGHSDLWRLRPSSYLSVFPRGTVINAHGQNPGMLRLKFTTPTDTLDEDRLGKEIQSELKTIRYYLESSAANIEKFNQQLRRTTKEAVERRKERLEKTEGLASRLGLPIKPNPNAPAVTPIKVERKLVRPLPQVQAGSYEPEYGIDDEVYEHILSVIRHETATFEATPGTYSGMGEEDLRNVLLAHLNGHYEGGATGETFRKGGKTDIHIEEENRAAFIAECKLWSGPKGVSAALDQLLGYLTWRDCKAALIFFNKSTKGFSTLPEKANAELQGHDHFLRELQDNRKNAEWRFVFHASDDEHREIVVHVFLADLYVPT